MMAAAAFASPTTSGGTARPASASTASRRRGLRAAMAEATATPQRCASVKAPPFITADTLSRMSLATSGMAARRASRASTLGHLQRGLARLPVARAQLAGLQGVEDAQHLVHVPAHREVAHRGQADDALRVDDERGRHG